MPARGRSIGGPLLLASAASADEAVTALLAGAAVIDLKDPRRGPLGACSPAVWRAARRDCRGLDPARPMSAAAGPACARSAARLAGIAARIGFDYVKVGLEGLPRPDSAIAALRPIVAVARRARPGVRVIAATYADARRVRALPALRLPEVARLAGCDGCLLDTAVKEEGTLLDHLGLRSLERFVASCRRRSLLCALAGSIRFDQIEAIGSVGPDFIGARGALCEGGRTGRIDPARVRAFSGALLPGAPVETGRAGLRRGRRSPAPAGRGEEAQERADRRRRAAPGSALPAVP